MKGPSRYAEATGKAHTGSHALAFCPMGGAVIALQADRIRAVADRDLAARPLPDAGEVDLARMLGLRLTSQRADRRRLDVLVEGEIITLIVGEQVIFASSRAEPVSLPRFLGGLATRGIVRMHRFRDTYAFEIDPVEIVRTTTSPAEQR